MDINLGSLLKSLQDYPAAAHLLQESLSLCQELGHRWAAAVCLRHLGDLARLQKDFLQAQSQYLDSLALHREIGDLPGTRQVMLDLANLLQETGDLQRALAVLLRIDQEFGRAGAPATAIQKRIAKLEEKLPAAARQEAVESSRSKPLAEILACRYPGRGQTKPGHFRSRQSCTHVWLNIGGDIEDLLNNRNNG